jgi:hypothetical protein
MNEIRKNCGLALEMEESMERWSEYTGDLSEDYCEGEERIQDTSQVFGQRNRADVSLYQWRDLMGEAGLGVVNTFQFRSFPWDPRMCYLPFLEKNAFSWRKCSFLSYSSILTMWSKCKARLHDTAVATG